MKLARFGLKGSERPALVNGAGRFRDVSAQGTDIYVEAIPKLAGVMPEALPLVEQDVRLGVPVAGTRKFIAIGLNYTDHAAESGMALPSEPTIFMKATSSLPISFVWKTWGSVARPCDDAQRPPRRRRALGSRRRLLEPMRPDSPQAGVSRGQVTWKTLACGRPA